MTPVLCMDGHQITVFIILTLLFYITYIVYQLNK